MSRRKFIAPALADRAKRVLHPWSGADAAERQIAREILHSYQQQELRRRIAIADEFRPGAEA